MTDESLEARLVEAADKALRGLTPSVIPASDGFAFVWPSNYARHLTVAVLAQIRDDGLVLVGVEDLREVFSLLFRARMCLDGVAHNPRRTRNAHDAEIVADAIAEVIGHSVTEQLITSEAGLRLRAAAFDADTEQPEAK